MGKERKAKGRGAEEAVVSGRTYLAAPHVSTGATRRADASDLALQEYSTLVHSLDPSAVPPVTPSSSVANLLETPDLSDSDVPEPSPASTTLSTADSISNLLVGQKGVHRLFHDFTSTLTAKEKALHSAHAKIEELERSLRALQEQLAVETTARVAAQNERETAMRDDGSAAKVVERYMTFTQKTHATVHMHLDNLRARSTATQASLRSEISTLRSQLRAESSRAEKLRSALDEMSEGTLRETAGRRREVALRLKMLAIEEKRERKVEAWLDKVRRGRAGAEGAVIEPDILEALLDEGVDAVEKEQPSLEQPKAWKRMLRKKPSEPAIGGDEREESLARVLLAEELVNTLVEDLQIETERRTELEKQRVEWLAKEAVEGVPASATFNEGDDAHAMFDLDDEKPETDGELKVDIESTESQHTEAKISDADIDDVDELDKPDTLAPPPLPLPTPSPLSETPPLLPQLGELFAPLTSRYEPLQKRLHDLSHSLDVLRETPSTPKTAQRKPLLNLSRRADHTLETLLDSVHEVIEDARVDVEIALADEERVYRGFEALLGVGRSGAVQGKEVLRDAEEYVQSRREWEGYVKLDKRVLDIESDITGIKRVIHESEGMDTGEEGSTKWADVDLKTVSLPRRFPTSPVEGEERPKASRILSNVGRSFSSNIIGAPRRVGSFAGSLYRPKDRRADGDVPGTPDSVETKESEGLLARAEHASDDVE